jgi:hypothetical protein
LLESVVDAVVEFRGVFDWELTLAAVEEKEIRMRLRAYKGLFV